MRSTYFEFDGGRGRFLSPDDLFPNQKLVDFIVQHGQQALDALDDAGDQLGDLVEEMIGAGLLERDGGGGLRMTPRMIRGMQHRALLEIFRGLKAGVKGGHGSTDAGRAGERLEGTKPYEFGDPLSEVALSETMRNALRRTGEERAAAGAGAGAWSAPLPLRLRDGDFELHNVESLSDTAMCVLIDLSGSMARYGRHVAAKRVAMGMRELVRSRFPQDTIDFVGFASVAEEIPERDLPLVMPKPITTRSWEVRVRVPLAEAGRTHPHMTNLHDALRVARGKLARRSASNRQIFIITDGQPTAHLTDGPAGQTLNLIYPPSQESVEATLTEALCCRRAGIRISTFALIEEYYGMDWVGFVDQLTRLVRGVAFYCAAGDLGATIVESYLSGKRTKRAVG